MKTAIVETKQGFLRICRLDPRKANFFSKHLSDAVKLEPNEAQYFADRYQGTVQEVHCADCGTLGEHYCPADVATGGEDEESILDSNGR